MIYPNQLKRLEKYENHSNIKLTNYLIEPKT